ncbi:MAG: quinone-dependent dihydroorotate dehydrogenase [Gammaproteobacteria bacterium]|jgi:dihydroorotate dehydrogenase|nr:quinone-dependent dihydroorotate dehydrogenase [Gammaproteobacteria bacterium]
MSYQLLRPLLFKLEPEFSHHVSLKTLKLMYQLKLAQAFLPKVCLKPKKLWGLEFANAVGLAAGLDKNGDYIDCLAALGFGFIEVGTVTPKAQEGNPNPRLFRLPKARALINRMGFNNKGIDYLIEQVIQAKYQGVLGINIGKNASTPIELALDDYVIGMQKAYPHASYITVNISSPNTAGLRQLQHGEFLNFLLAGIKLEQANCERLHHKKVPILIKVAPDLTEQEVIELADAFLRHQIEGIIATNTTVSRAGVEAFAISKQAGGLSGFPLLNKSTEILKLFKQELKGQIPIIASGGIVSEQAAQEKMAAGADLVQLYTGLIYQGPALVKRCAELL